MVSLSSSAWPRAAAASPIATTSYFIVTVVVSSAPASASFAAAPGAKAVTRSVAVAGPAAAG